MLSLGLKNAILFLLIVMILHVLIKNALIEKGTLPKTIKEMYTEKTEKVKEKEPEDIKKQEETKAKETKKEEPKAKDSKKEKEESTTENFDTELLKYVYDDDNTDLAKYFKGMDVTKDVTKDIEKKIECTVLEELIKNDLPISTTCDPALKTASDANAKRIKADCDLKQTSAFMTLKEYEEENMMNGGSIYGDLKGFDSFDEAFEEYACSNSI
jgi:hypothetical protein